MGLIYDALILWQQATAESDRWHKQSIRRSRQARRFYCVLHGRLEAMRMAYQRYSTADTRKLEQIIFERDMAWKELRDIRVRQAVAELHESRNATQRALLANAVMEAELRAARAAFGVPLPADESIADAIQSLVAQLRDALEERDERD